MRVLCLDPAKNLGWCHGDITENRPIYGAHSLPDAKLSRVGLALEGFLLDIIKANGIQRIYFEEPVMVQQNGFKAIAAIMSKPIVIAMTAERLGVEAIPIAMQTWRSGFGSPQRAPKMTDDQLCSYMGWPVKVLKPEKRSTARRKWLKDATIAHCVSLGYKPEDDDAADAIGIWRSVMNKHALKESMPMLDLQDGLLL